MAVASKTMSRHNAVCIVVICLAQACSPAPSVPALDLQRPVSAHANQFSAQERSAAKKLSLAGETASFTAGNAYDRALRCRNALAALTSTFRKTEVTTGEQLALLDRAIKAYERRVVDQAANSGRSADEARDDLAKGSGESPNMAEEARTGLACLRSLAGVS
jgi:hypothetical protein